MDRLFEEALERPPAERDAFLARAAAQDPELVREVRELLDAERRSLAVLGESALAFAAPLLAADAEEADGDAAAPPGEWIGPYRIQREIGRGGMGTVYLAERADDQYRKVVALKLVRRGMDTDEVLRRFRRERQILATLEHPNIARLLDGGAAPDGRPYLVMEAIEGRPITSWSDEHRLGVAQRVTLFRTVCLAVQHAHQSLVVHRDVKPSNVLVDHEGQVKLLDFGIAKVLGGDAATAPVETRAGRRMLTPEYAAPEQLRGLPLTTATDVYSLGVLLYELLAGRRPFEVAGRTPVEAERVVLAEEPAAPSTAVCRAPHRLGADGQREGPAEVASLRATTPDRLVRTLRGDLDAIVLRALDKDPARRYPSAAGLHDDLERWHAGLPVAARPPTRSYRATKFLRRHRAPVAVGALLLLLAFTSVAAIAVLQARTARERDRATLERDKAEQVVAFMEDLFTASDPFAAGARTDTLRVRDFLGRGAVRIREELEGQPLLQARLGGVIGRVYRRLGLYEEARPLLEQALANARAMLPASHPDLADALTNLGLLHLDAGDYTGAQPLLEEAFAVRLRAHGAAAPELAEAQNHLGSLLREQGRYDEARSLHQAALATLAPLAGEEVRRAAVHYDLARTLERNGDFVGAERHARSALALERTLYGDGHPAVAAGLEQVGLLLQRKGDYEAAEALARQALTETREVLGEEHPLTVSAMNRLASVLRWKGELLEAEPLFRRALELKRRIYGGRHLEVAVGLYNLAPVVRDLGGLEEAEGLYRESLAMARALGGEDHPYVGIYQGGLATVLTARGDCAGAEMLWREALERMRRTMTSDRYNIPWGKRWLGDCLVVLGRYAEAEPVLLEGYRELRASLGDDHPFVPATRSSLAQLYAAWGKPETAALYAPAGTAP